MGLSLCAYFDGYPLGMRACALRGIFIALESDSPQKFYKFLSSFPRRGRRLGVDKHFYPDNSGRKRCVGNIFADAS